jgi:aspartokinase
LHTHDSPAQIFSVLARDGVNIYFIGQGATEINISVVVDEVDALRAMDNIHTHVLGIPHQNNAIKGVLTVLPCEL